MTHNFTVTGSEVFFFEEDETLVIAMGSILGYWIIINYSGLIILLFVGLLFCRRILH